MVSGLFVPGSATGGRPPEGSVARPPSAPARMPRGRWPPGRARLPGAPRGAIPSVAGRPQEGGFSRLGLPSCGRV